jgi:predicted aspartyl protease
LHIDISDDSKQEQFILSSQFEELKIFNSNLLKRASQVENELTNALEEVTSYFYF